MAAPPVDESLVNALAKMVDVRVKAEFEKRDEMILSLKAGMDKLVETLRSGKGGLTLTDGGSWLANGGPQPQLSSGSNSTLTLTDRAAGNSKPDTSPWGARPDRPPRRKKRQHAARKYGTRRRHPVRKGHRAYKSLPAVAHGAPARDGYGRLEYYANVPRVASIREVGHNTRAAIARRSEQAMSYGREYDRLSVEKLDYPECKSTVFRPTDYDERKIDKTLPDSSLELEFVYGYAGFSPTMVGDLPGDQNIFYLPSGEMIYPASAVIVIYNPKHHTQRFFCEHNDDITGIAVHPGEHDDNGNRVSEEIIIASGQVATQRDGHKVEPVILIWDANKGPLDSRGKATGLVVQELSGHTRNITAMDFSPDGKLLMSIGGDDHHSVFIWDWRDGEILAEAKGHASHIVTCGFNPYQSRTVDQAVNDGDNNFPDEGESGMLSDMHYTLVSCGKKHIKFWTFSMVPDPEFASAQSKVGGMGDSEAPPLPGKKSVDLAAKPKKKGTLTDDEVENRNGERMKFVLEGDTGKFGKEKIQDILCICFAPYDKESGEETCAIITGAQDGSIIFWEQIPIPPDSEDEEEDEDEDEDEACRARLPWWDSSGKLIHRIPGVHKGGVYGIQLTHTGRIVTTGADGTIKLWDIEENEKEIREPGRKIRRIQHPTLVSVGEGLDAEACLFGKNKKGKPTKPRSMIAGGEDAPGKIIVGTCGNEIIEFQVNGDEITVTENKVLMNSHELTLQGVATHPMKKRFLTACEDKTVGLWDYEDHVLLGIQVELPAPSQCCDFSHDGDLIACGLTTGWFVVYKGGNSEDASLEQIVHKSAAPVRAGAGPPPGVKSGAKETKLQKQLKEKQQARSGKQKMFKVEEACEIRFSPDSSRLAVGSRDNNIYIFDCTKNFRRVGICRGHTSYITHIDWSDTGEFLQSNSGDYELLYWQAPESETFRKSHIVAGSPRGKSLQRRWEQYRDMSDMADCQWKSWTCALGFPVMGIWPPYSDGTDVNMVDRTKNRQLVATAEDTKMVGLMRFPCLKGAERKDVSLCYALFLIFCFHGR